MNTSSEDNKAVQETEGRIIISIYEPEDAEENNNNIISHRSLRKNLTLSHKKILGGS